MTVSVMAVWDGVLDGRPLASKRSGRSSSNLKLEEPHPKRSWRVVFSKLVRGSM